MMSEHEHSAQALPGDRFLGRIHVVWAGIYFLCLGLSLAWALASPPGALHGWALAAALAGVATSAALFQGLYWPAIRCLDAWPMAWRSALTYFGGQFLALAVLLALSDSFVGLGFALLGQVLGVLRPRHWALALVPLLALLARPLGWLNLGPGSDWLGLASLVLMLGIWLFVAILLSLLFTQRFRLLGLVSELRAAHLQLEAAAQQQEELAVLRERTRVAREMHDSLGHALVSVNVKLEVAQRLYRVDAARADDELEATRALVRATMGELRRSLAALRSPPPDERDLPAALRRLADEVGSRGTIQVSVAADSQEGPDPAVAEALFLIAREALLNVERHARATRATVWLGRTATGWSLEVRDDGVGFPPAELRKPGHFGVVGMRERAAALGGSLEVRSHPQRGTCVATEIPSVVRDEP
jgi:signal transduction histidine kinase